MDAGFLDQAIFEWCDAEQVGYSFTTLLGSTHAWRPGTCVSDARIDHQRTNFAARFKVTTAKLYRGGAKAVLCKHSGDTATRIERQQGQIPTIELTNTGLGDAETNAGDGVDGFRGGRSVIDGHLYNLLQGRNKVKAR